MFRIAVAAAHRADSQGIVAISLRPKSMLPCTLFFVEIDRVASLAGQPSLIHISGKENHGGKLFSFIFHRLKIINLGNNPQPEGHRLAIY